MGGETMKKVCALLMCLVLMIGIPALGLANSDGAVVNNPNPQDRLHLRVSPSTTSTSLGKYYNGAPVMILEYRDDGWLKVGVGCPVEGTPTYQGYMLEKYLTNFFNGAADRVKSAMPEYMATSTEWKLYNTPSKSASYTTYGYGEEIRLMGFTDTWWHILIMRNGTDYASGFVPAGSFSGSLDTAVVNNPNSNDRLHLRVSRSVTATSLGKYYNGTKVTVLAHPPEPGWAKVRVGNTEGYMMDQYLAFGTEADGVRDMRPTVRVTGGKVNLREAPSLNAKSLGQYSNGTEMKVWGICGEWLHVANGVKSGYMLASLLSSLPGGGSTTPSPIIGQTARLSQDAYLYQSADENSATVAFLGENTQLTIDAVSGSWYKVHIGRLSGSGWIKKSILFGN
jgi:uncharacterized protein YgiM (DUF1202 family)